jgi:hypothetical protein
MTEIGDADEESVASGFIMAFLTILAFCFVMNYYIGHKFHVSDQHMSCITLPGCDPSHTPCAGLVTIQK